MLDADLAATDAGKLARFAERVRDLDAPPSGEPADRVRRLFGRAALVRQWPTVRASFAPPPPTSDATLAERSRQLAERCRGGRKAGWFGGWPKEANELLGEAADRLVQLADRLDAAHAPHRPRRPTERGARRLEYQFADGPSGATRHHPGRADRRLPHLRP